MLAIRNRFQVSRLVYNSLLDINTSNSKVNDVEVPETQCDHVCHIFLGAFVLLRYFCWLRSKDDHPHPKVEGSTAQKWAFIHCFVSRHMVPIFPSSDAANNMCAVQLSTMLSCWAATGDLHSANQCKEAAQTLFHCMRTTVRP